MMQAKLRKELDLLRSTIDSAISAYFTLKTIHVELKRNKRLPQDFNRHPWYWSTVLYSLQTNQFISLARVFDRSTHHSIQDLLEFCQKHSTIFSRGALSKRRENDFKSKAALQEYITKAYVPQTSDFNRLKRLVDLKEKKVEKYKLIRHRLFGHTVLTSKAQIEMAFRQTRVEQIEDTLLFINRFHAAIEMLFYNGRKPLMRKLRLPLKNTIIQETREFLKSICDDKRESLTSLLMLEDKNEDNIRFKSKKYRSRTD